MATVTVDELIRWEAYSSTHRGLVWVITGSGSTTGCSTGSQVFIENELGNKSEVGTVDSSGNFSFKSDAFLSPWSAGDIRIIIMDGKKVCCRSGWIEPILKKPKKSPCFITTAAYGSEAEEELALLHDLRDNVVKQTRWGRRFFDEYDRVYYRFSPQIAGAMHAEPEVKEMIKWAFVRPWMSYVKLVIKRPTDWTISEDNVQLVQFLKELRNDFDTWISDFEVPDDFTGLDNKAVVDELNIALGFVLKENGMDYLDRLTQKGILPIVSDEREFGELEKTLRSMGRSDAEVACILGARGAKG